MRALIIGCGYLGLPLGAELVQRGHEVFGLRRNSSSAHELERAGINPLLADITQPETLAKLPRNFDWVVNCVASGGGSADDYRQVYLEGMRNVVDWLVPSDSTKRKPRMPRFVYTSSTSIYGQNDGSTVDETSPTEPTAETARVLLETEKLLLDAAHEIKFSAMILRVAAIYGPGRGYWFKQFVNSEARLEGKGERILNMIHRDDVIGCIISTLERGESGNFYNAVDDEPVSQFDFFSWLSRALGKPMPDSIPPSTESARKRGVTNKRVSNQKLKSKLGYQFKFPTYREGYLAEIQALPIVRPQ
ncbi:MAG TPA: SDR family oxidoreductase [Verrucomicrobiae bacterium]|nr:SDR family oxidoreductase [Verrucomicrobiae bacterium]